MAGASHVVYQPLHHHHNIQINARNPRSDLLGLLQADKKCRRFIWIIIPLAILSAILFLGMKLLAGPGTLDQSSSGANDFSPYSTLTFPVSGLYCVSYTLTTYLGGATETLSWITSIYILKESPLLSSKHNFSIYRGKKNMITLNPGEFYQWSVLLHAGSSYEVNSCVWEGPEVGLYVIRGQANFREWIHTKDNYYDKMSLTRCNQSRDEQYNIPQARNVTKDGKYYFVYSSLQSTTALQKGQYSQVHVDMSFTKLEYSLNDNNVYCYREAEVDILYTKYQSSYETCDIPLTFSGFVLIKTTPKVAIDRDMNWEDKIHVTWSCDGSYNAYLLLFCLPIMLFCIVGLLCSDLPKLLAHYRCKSRINETEQTSTVQPVPIHWKKPLIVLLLILCVLLALMGSLSICFIILPILLKVLSLITSDIPGLANNDLKLSLLAASALLFVIAFFCNKFKSWVQNKVIVLVKQMRLLQNDNSITPSTPRTFSMDTKLKLFQVLYIFYLVPIFIIAVSLASVLCTFMEGFYPVLIQYGSETDYDIYNPGDSRVFSFNSFFCSEYSISGYGSPHLSASLQILDPSSGLVQNHSISHITSNEMISAGAGATWNFYLNSDSSGNMSVCIYDSDQQYAASTVLEIYTYDAYGMAGERKEIPIKNICSIPIINDTQQISIKERLKGHAGYYFVWLNTSANDLVNVYIDIVLDRYKYSVKSGDSSNKHMCSISSHTNDTCTVSAPSTAGKMSGLILVDSDETTVNWHETFSIKKTCEYHWATWTALWLPVLLLNVVFFSVFFGITWRASYKAELKKLANKYAPQTENDTVNHTQATQITNNGGYGATDPTDRNEGSSHLADPEIVPTSTDPCSVVIEAKVEPNPSPSGSNSHSVQIEPNQSSQTLESIPVDDNMECGVDHENNADAPLLQNAGAE